MIIVFENYGKDYLQKFFEDEGFNVDIFEQDNQRCAEIEKWTDGGVDMIINLIPFTKEEFIDYVNDFDVDDLIDTYRQDVNYKKNFTISQSLKDFKKFHSDLKKVVKKMESKNFIMNQKASKYNI
jgi:hypothetical protein